MTTRTSSAGGRSDGIRSSQTAGSGDWRSVTETGDHDDDDDDDDELRPIKTTTSPLTEQDGDVLTSKPSVEQLRQKFTVDQQTSRDNAARRVSHMIRPNTMTPCR